MSPLRIFQASLLLLLSACSRADPGGSPSPGASGAHGGHPMHGPATHGGHPMHGGAAMPAGSAMHGDMHGGHGVHGGAASGHPMHGGPAPSGALAEVARVHGNAGPWAVAGYRMGQHALAKLGLGRQSFDLDVTHRGPLEPQYACIADGASAATGASVGKVNLKLEAAAEAELVTVYRRKSTGQTLALRPTAAFKRRFVGLPREQLQQAGEQVLGLRDDEIFEEAR